MASAQVRGSRIAVFYKYEYLMTLQDVSITWVILGLLEP
jgi:hypothetical protein